MTTWKDVIGYAGTYQVSNTGEVRSKRVVGYALLSKWVNCGYELVHLSKNGVQKQKRVHRLVAEAFIPNPNNYNEVNHKDGNKLNNFVENLEWCDSSYNQKHAYTIGLKVQKQGELNPNAKLTNEQVKAIREECLSGASQKDIAMRYGISSSTVSRIHTGQRGYRLNNKIHLSNNMYKKSCKITQ